MAFVSADRIKETTTTSGTGTVTLAGAVSGFRTFSSVMATSDTCYYCIDDGAGAWEVGVGTLASSTTLARTTVLASSNAGALVSFAATSKNVYITGAAKGLATLDPAGTLTLTSEGTTAPSAAATGKLGLFAKSIAGRDLPAFIGSTNVDSPIQSHLARVNATSWKAYPGATTQTGLGMTVAPTGTATAKTNASTNIHTQTTGLDFLVTVAATTAVAGYRLASAAAGLTVWRGNAAGLGGFLHVVRFSPATGITGVGTSRIFVGLSNLTAAATDVDPSTLTSMVGVGYAKGTDANWTIYGNDATGTAGKYSTGIAIPTVDRPGVYEVAIFCKPNDTQITVQFTDVGAGTTFTQVITTAADLVPNTTFLAGRGYASVGGTSSVTGFTLFSVYNESDI